MAKILVVDDLPINRQFLVTLLGYYGHRLLEAQDGAQALELVRAEHPDLVITDIVMPTMDGIEFVLRLRADPALAKTEVIFYTATYRLREAKRLAEVCTVSHVIPKPSDPDFILRAVNKALGIAEGTQPQPQVQQMESPPFSVLGGKLSPHLGDLQELNRRLGRTLEGGFALVSEESGPIPIPDRLVGSLIGLQSISLRLTGVIEACMELSSERDPERLLETFGRAVQDVVSAKYVGLGLLGLDGQSLRQFLARGMDADVMARLGAPPARGGQLGQVLAERRPRRLRNPGGNPQGVGLPATHPPVHSFLAVPFASPTALHGWLYLGDKIGGEEFSEDDEQLASVLAGAAALAYDNIMLYDEIQRRAVELELEVIQRRRAEEEIRRLNEGLEQRITERTAELEAVNKELESFSYSVAHDLRGPLRSLDGFSQILLEDYNGQLDTQGKDYLLRVRSGAQRMAQLIDDLLRLSRVTRGEIRREAVDLSGAARSVVTELQKTQPERQLDIRIEDGMVVHGDGRLLRLVLENLIGNAWKFTSKHPRATIEFGVTERDGRPAYFVRDDGAGFDMAYADKLFGPFQRLHGPAEFSGTGIGLATVQRIIHRHGGRVWAEGGVETGATIYFMV